MTIRRADSAFRVSAIAQTGFWAVLFQVNVGKIGPFSYVVARQQSVTIAAE